MARPTPEQVTVAAMAADFVLFCSTLVDGAGRPFRVAAHQVAWARAFTSEPRLVLRAPRGHGKTSLLIAYIAWCCWRHGRPGTGTVPGAPFEAVMFSATIDQARLLMVHFRELLLANEALFADLLPATRGATARRTRWSSMEVRLRNMALLRIRSYRASVRGMHPDLLVLDDVLNDANSLSEVQRERTLRYFMNDLLPMRTKQIVLVGTAIHQNDLLAELGKGTRGSMSRRHTALGFRAMTYRALDEATGEALWPEAFPADELRLLRDVDPVMFSREYQNDPRDDASSLFPFEVVQRAIDAGAPLVLGTGHPADIGEIVVLGMDIARSAAAGADYTVVVVVAWQPGTGARRVLDVRREKGLEFQAQIELVADLVVRHRVEVGYIEDNGMQQWLIDELIKHPATRERVGGHRTGRNKAMFPEGIPGLAMSFKAGAWIIPSGDRVSLRLARQFQAELGAFGYRNGRYGGVGEHDDMVMAAWLAECVIREIESALYQPLGYEIVTMEQLGIERVRIGPDF